jgi:hypothetical protein
MLNRQFCMLYVRYRPDNGTPSGSNKASDVRSEALMDISGSLGAIFGVALDTFLRSRIGRRHGRIPRNGAAMLAMTAMACSGSQAVADSRQPSITRHQLNVKTVGCMWKRMSVDRTVSYNEAAKTCKDQIAQQNDNRPPVAPRRRLPGALVAIDSPRNP